MRATTRAAAGPGRRLRAHEHRPLSASWSALRAGFEAPCTHFSRRRGSRRTRTTCWPSHRTTAGRPADARGSLASVRRGKASAPVPRPPSGRRRVGGRGPAKTARARGDVERGESGRGIATLVPPHLRLHAARTSRGKPRAAFVGSHHRRTASAHSDRAVNLPRTALRRLSRCHQQPSLLIGTQPPHNRGVAAPRELGRTPLSPTHGPSACTWKHYKKLL
jgi:hypothetical protein